MNEDVTAFSKRTKIEVHCYFSFHFFSFASLCFFLSFFFFSVFFSFLFLPLYTRQKADLITKSYSNDLSVLHSEDVDSVELSLFKMSSLQFILCGIHRILVDPEILGKCINFKKYKLLLFFMLLYFKFISYQLIKINISIYSTSHSYIICECFFRVDYFHIILAAFNEWESWNSWYVVQKTCREQVKPHIYPFSFASHKFYKYWQLKMHLFKNPIIINI